MRSHASTIGYTCRRTAALAAALVLLTGCQGVQNVPQQPAGAPGLGVGQPVQLLKSAGSQAGDAAGISVRQPIDERELGKAVERYRLNKRLPASPFRSVGADLDGNGEPEALVLLEGEKWCARTGCTLAIFSKGPTGYNAIATVRRVRAPVLVANEKRNGWSSLVVATGLPGPRENRVWLRFGANGYPGNAVMQTPMPSDIQVPGETVFEKRAEAPQSLASGE